MTTGIHAGDVGTVFEVTVTENGQPVNLSSATSKKLYLKGPGGVAVRDVQFVTDGTDGKLQYTTVAGDIQEAGTWSVQVHVSLPAGIFRSSISTFKVYENL